MAKTREIEALEDAARLIEGIADSLAKGDTLNVAPDDLRSFADDLKLTAREADDRMRKGEFLPDDVEGGES